MKLFLLAIALYAVKAEWVPEMEIGGNWQGDIVLDPDEFEVDWNKVQGDGGQVYASIKGGRWPTTIKYKISNGLSSGVLRSLSTAIANYHKYTCLKFVRDDNCRGSCLNFYRGSGCSSPVGHRSGRTNSISLANGCWKVGTVMHEIGHSLGLYHEQSRPDRDSYVTINLNNVQSSARFNFNKQRASNIDSKGTSYDYGSMMHYGAYAFSSNGRATIVPKRSGVTIGQRNGFSSTDKVQINAMYCAGGGGGGGSCADKDSRCPGWTSYCGRNSYVDTNCKKTCRTC